MSQGFWIKSPGTSSAIILSHIHFSCCITVSRNSIDHHDGWLWQGVLFLMHSWLVDFLDDATLQSQLWLYSISEAMHYVRNQDQCTQTLRENLCTYLCLSPNHNHLPFTAPRLKIDYQYVTSTYFRWPSLRHLKCPSFLALQEPTKSNFSICKPSHILGMVHLCIFWRC